MNCHCKEREGAGQTRCGKIIDTIAFVTRAVNAAFVTRTSPQVLQCLAVQHR